MLNFKGMLAAAILFGSIVYAGTVSWDNGEQDSKWCSPQNWSTDQLPALTDDVYLNKSNDYTVIDNSCNAVCRALRGPGYTLGLHTLDITGGTLQTTDDAAYPWYIGASSHGTVNLSGGQVFCGRVYCGNSSGGVGKLNIYGGDFHVADHLVIGAASGGNGELNVGNTGRLTCEGTINCGSQGRGTTNIDGGTVTCTNTAVSFQMAVNTGSTSFLNMTGGLLDCAGDFWVSHYGIATINMNGGQLNAKNLYVPRVARGYGIVNLNAGKIKVFNLLMQHNSGYGVLNINGGVLMVKNDRRAMLQGYIKDGFIKAYSGNSRAHFFLDYDITNPGYTTLYANLYDGSYASEPYPENRDVLTGAQWDKLLTWKAGLGASSHRVYIGTDYDNVKNAIYGDPEYKAEVTGESFSFDQAQYDKTYYWRVDAKSGTTYKQGPVWKFKYLGTHEPIYHFDLRYTQGLTPEKRYDIRHAVVCLQGLVNRDGPKLYLSFHNQDRMWLERITEKGGLCQFRSVHEIQTIEELWQLFKHKAVGIIAYDPDPQTGAISSSLVATTAAGVENAVAVRRDLSAGSMYNFLKNDPDGPAYPVIIDMAYKFTGTGTIWQTDTPSTGSKKCDAYIWAKQKYIDTGKCDTTLISYSLDLWGLKVETDLWTQLSNLDYAVTRKGFCLELSPWGNEIPNDDPYQPLGTDLNTFKAILDGCNVQNNYSQMIKCTGFINFQYKYTANVGGGHEGWSTEWELVRLLTAYNTYLEADAAAGSYISNCSFGTWFRPQVTGKRYVQNPAPTYQDMQNRGLIDANGNVVDGNYILFCMGDYDQASWTTYYLAGERYDDSERGNVNCNWGCNPSASDRAMMAFDYLYRKKSQKDTFMAWDSGAGYVNPAQLHGKREPSGYDSAVDIWREHCKKYYRWFDYSISAWLLNGHAEQMTYMDIYNYAPFSGDGMNLHDPDIWIPFIRDNIVGTDMGHYSEPHWTNFINYDSGVHFRAYRSILQYPAKVAELEQIWAPKGNNHRFLDAYTFFYLLRYYYGGNNNYRATWLSDNIEPQIKAAKTYNVQVEVRNDGWDTWTNQAGYKLGYAIVAAGRKISDADFNINSAIPVDPAVSVEPGQTVTFDLTIDTPNANGNYDLYYDMRSDDSGWFRNKNNIEWKMAISLTEAQDINDDMTVDFADMTFVADNWLNSNIITEDYTAGEKVAHWSFDENQGQTTADTTGRGHTGYINGCSWENGVYGYCLDFDGVDDYVSVQDSPDLTFDGDFTISAWINPDYTQSQEVAVVAKVLDTSQKEYALSMYGNQIQLDMEKDANDGNARNKNGVISTGQWQHIAVVFESSTYAVKFYHNGIPLVTSSNSINGFSTWLGNALNIGRWGGTYNSKHFAGKIDDVRIYNYHLTKPQINRVYQGLEPLPQLQDICRIYPIGDINGDCKADFNDFAEIGKTWLINY